MSNQLFFLSLADIFSVYPSIFKELIATRAKPTQIFLPSDSEWQEKMYYRLLEVQKRVNEAIDSGVQLEEVTRKKDKPAFDPARLLQKFSPTTSPTGLRFDNRKRCTAMVVPYDKQVGTFWSMENICMAARLLKTPPLAVAFRDEYEMRKVYSLIYDVFRYKVVLANALKDIGFFELLPQYLKDKNCTWLMLYELFNRQFRRRHAEDIATETQLYRDAHVEDIAAALWAHRVRLSASICRMRIRFGALHLSQLLPVHLQNEKVAIAAANPMVTGWINPFQISDKVSTDRKLTDMGFSIKPADDNNPILLANECKWDNMCPLFISCIPEDRGQFTKTDLMTKHYFIMQDKTFSYGPAIMSRLLDFFELDGDILQTHISSPRSTAYLAALFYSVNRVNNFYVYGAGSNLKEYRKYMDTLGVTNIRIFAESFTSFPLESKRFATVVGIFANPPNSFSAISDPIDLICSRGGDLSMLEVLTESEISDDGKQRVSLILDEQLHTLQMAMSRPQIQFVLYQTHSIVNAENQDMVRYVVDLINGVALNKHKCAYRERKRLEALAEAEAANIPSAAVASVSSPRKRTDDKTKPADAAAAAAAAGEAAPEAGVSLVPPIAAEDSEENVLLPEIDEFVLEDIPDICLNQDNCFKLKSTGCFMALIKRSSITHLNAKYLIKMAETRGLFGKADKTKSARHKAKSAAEGGHPEGGAKNAYGHGAQLPASPVNIDTLIQRLMADTNASYIRSGLTRASAHTTPIKFNFKKRHCARYIIAKTLKLSCCQSRSKLLWRYAAECIRAAGGPGHEPKDPSKFHCSRITKWKLKHIGHRRHPYPVHVHEIHLLTNLRQQIRAIQLKTPPTAKAPVQPA